MLTVIHKFHKYVYKSYFDIDVSHDLSLTQCSKCGMRYSEDILEDLLEHAVRCSKCIYTFKKYSEFSDLLAPWSERRGQNYSRDLIANSDITQKIKGALRLMFCSYIKNINDRDFSSFGNHLERDLHRYKSEFGRDLTKEVEANINKYKF